MKKNHRNRCRPLSFEALESRLPLAGEVIVKASGGNMVITGDNLANNLTIDQLAPGMFRIYPNDGETFRLNGVVMPSADLDVTNVTKDIKINLKGGDDRIGLSGLTDAVMARNVIINTGNDSDQVTLDTVNNVLPATKITGKLSINVGKDSEFDTNDVIIRAVNVAKSTSVTGGRALDNVEVSAAAFAGKVTIKTGASGDNVVINSTNFLSHLTINMGSATDDLDNVEIDGIMVNGKLAITSGNGDDSITVNNSTLKTATVKTGSGDDDVTVNGVTIQQATVSLGSGDDEFDIGAAGLTLLGPKKSKVVGGKGLDAAFGSANLVGAEFLVDPLKTGVETIA